MKNLVFLLPMLSLLGCASITDKPMPPQQVQTATVTWVATPLAKQKCQELGVDLFANSCVVVVGNSDHRRCTVYSPAPWSPADTGPMTLLGYHVMQCMAWHR